MSLENKLSWKGKTARIAASVLLPVASLLSYGKTARADESDYLPADFNKDGIVDVRDMTDFAEEWVKSSGEKTRISISECGCLNEPNAVYVLQNDINDVQGTCFEIGADGVSLDLNNKNLVGSGIGKEDCGIYVSNCNNVTISNGGFIVGFQYGIYLKSSLNNKIKNIHEFANKYGVYLESCSGNVISDIGGFFDHYGIYLKSSLNNKIKRIIAGDCSYDGISLIAGSNNNILKNVTLQNNGENGLRMSQSEDNTVKNSILDGNYVVDVYLKDNSTNNVFLNTNNCCSFPSDFIEEVYDNSSLIRIWSYTALVQDSSGRPIANAKVYGNRADGELEFMLRTGVDGKLKLPIISYINDCGIKEEFAPYIITAEKENLLDSHVYSPNGSNLEDIFILK
jgi:parallel beta-helix repeat protein